LNRCKNFAIVGKASYSVFGEHLFAIDFNIEDAAAAGDHIDFDVAERLQFIRQTGGLRLVVSLHAVGDGNLHSIPFGFIKANDLRPFARGAMLFERLL